MINITFIPQEKVPQLQNDGQVIFPLNQIEFKNGFINDEVNALFEDTIQHVETDRLISDLQAKYLAALDDKTRSSSYDIESIGIILKKIFIIDKEIHADIIRFIITELTKLNADNYCKFATNLINLYQTAREEDSKDCSCDRCECDKESVEELQLMDEDAGEEIDLTAPIDEEEDDPTLPAPSNE